MWVVVKVDGDAVCSAWMMLHGMVQCIMYPSHQLWYVQPGGAITMLTPPPPFYYRIHSLMFAGYPPTAIGYPPTAIGYLATSIGYPPTAIGYPLTTIGYTPTAIGYPPTTIGYTPTAIGSPIAMGYTPSAIAYQPGAHGDPPAAIVERIGHSDFFLTAPPAYRCIACRLLLAWGEVAGGSLLSW